MDGELHSKTGGRQAAGDGAVKRRDAHLEVEDLVAHAEADDGAYDVPQQDEQEGGRLEHPPGPLHYHHQPAPHPPQHRLCTLLLLPSPGTCHLAVRHLAAAQVLHCPLSEHRAVPTVDLVLLDLASPTWRL